MRITTVGLFLLLFPALVWAGTFRDDFNDGNFAGWQEADFGENGTVTAKNGELMVRNLQSSKFANKQMMARKPENVANLLKGGMSWWRGR